MTASEIRAEIRRLQALEKELEKAEREKHKELARKFVGKCYKRHRYEEPDVLCKIIGIPVETWDCFHTMYNQYQFPTLFLQYPDKIDERSYRYDHIYEFVPCYCDTIYLDVTEGRPGLKTDENEYFEEITPEEFNVEFDKCMAVFKEKINV